MVPNFRNLGAILRVLVFVNLLLLLTALVRTPALEQFPRHFVAMAREMELSLLVVALALYAGGPWLRRLDWRALTAVVSVFALATTLLGQLVWFSPPDHDASARGLLWAAGAALAGMAYFRWLQIAQMPALGEARILALTARIRPHFFFNSLNGVLGVMRSDPRRAEAALESLAELFRELMRDNRDLVTLRDEIELCHRYLDLERLRLGERLHVQWDITQVPLNAAVPPLLLQPLLENAVYHGIEPASEAGIVRVAIAGSAHFLDIEITNPAPPQTRRTSGNRMALENIRERLALFFDVEATLLTEERDGRFRVAIRMPVRLEKQ